MLKNEFDLSDEYMGSPGRSPKEGADSWLMSFADVVTVLLLFFIIFYMMEKNIKKNTGFGTKKGTIQEFVGIGSDPEVMTLVETVKKLQGIRVLETNQFLEIHFPPASFFDMGSTEISEIGREKIRTATQALSDIGDKYFVQVQGYTDDSTVGLKKDRWWKNNMELSVVRALKVREYMVDLGIKEENIIATGYGANRPLGGETAKNQRRITIKVEPKSYDEI